MRKIFELAGTISANGLEALRTGLKAVEGDLEKADKALTKFGRQSVKAGTILTKNLTVPMAAVGAAIGFMAVKTGQYADKLFDLEQMTGLNTDTLQEFENVARVAGVDFDGLVNVIGKMTNQLPEIAKGTGPAADAVKKLGVNLYDASGNTRDMNNLFPELIERLRQIPNITDRNALAMDLFGRSMKDIAPVLGLTSEEFESARKEAHDLGLVMSNESLQAADNFRKEVEKLKGQVTALWRGFAMQLMPILKDSIIPIIQTKVMPLFIRFGNAVKSVITYFTNLDPTAKKIIVGFIALLAAIGPVVLIMGKSILMVKGLVAAFALLKTAFAALTVAMATNPFLAALAIVGALTAAFIGAKIAKDALNESMAEDVISAESVVMEINLKIIDARRKALMALREEMIKNGKSTKELDIAIADLAEQERKARLTTRERAEEAGQAAKYTAEEIKKANKEQGASLVALQAEQDAQLDNEIEALERKRRASLDEVRERAKITGDKIKLAQEELLINNIYNRKIEDVQAEHAKKRKDEAKKAVDDRTAVEKAGMLKIMELQGDTVGLLKEQYAEDLKNFGDTEEKKAIIKTYYDKEIAKVEEKATKTMQEKWSDTIDFVGNSFSQLGSVYMMATQNKIAVNDKWYEKEKAAIEKSGVNAKKKEKMMESLDEKYNAKRTELQREQAKKEKAIAIFESIIGTASAVVKALPNIALSIIAGALGALKTAFIVAQPLPFAEGGLVKKRTGGINAMIGEGREDELVLPMESGIKSLADRLIERLASITLPPVPALAFAGAGSLGAGRGGDTHWHIGTLIADDRGIKELERRQSQFRISESQRKGQ